MTAEPPKPNQDRPVAPYAQEIEYALLLQRLISSVQNDPEQMRSTVYEYARARLQLDLSQSGNPERERLASALESAIHGVEAFSRRHDGLGLLPAPSPRPASPAPEPSREPVMSPAPAMAVEPVEPAPPPPPPTPPAIVTPPAQFQPRPQPPVPTTAGSQSAVFITPAEEVTRLRPYDPAAEDIIEPARGFSRSEMRMAIEDQTRTLVSTLVRFSIGMLLFAGILFLAMNRHTLPFLRDRFPPPASAVVTAAPVAEPPAPAQPPLPFPIPTDYGIYAIGGDDKLNELQPLPVQVPNKRIAVSTPINQPSRTTIPDGKAKFLIFRRDFAGNAPERVEVRVVARVVSSLSFDPKGKPNLVPVTDVWNIRNISYEFRVRPVPGHPEMLLVQPENPDFVLSPGRYGLVVLQKGYDFTVAGQVTDAAHCLERTDAANGEFYSECQKTQPSKTQ